MREAAPVRNATATRAAVPVCRGGYRRT
eukprot:gene11257-biopygen3844